MNTFQNRSRRHFQICSVSTSTVQVNLEARKRREISREQERRCARRQIFCVHRFSTNADPYPPSHWTWTSIYHFQTILPRIYPLSTKIYRSSTSFWFQIYLRDNPFPCHPEPLPKASMLKIRPAAFTDKSTILKCEFLADVDGSAPG